MWNNIYNNSALLYVYVEFKIKSHLFTGAVGVLQILSFPPSLVKCLHIQIFSKWTNSFRNGFNLLSCLFCFQLASVCKNGYDYEPCAFAKLEPTKIFR